MAEACTVLIAAPDLLPALTEREAASGSVEVLAFTDTDALKALGVITKRRPNVVALERMFASTPRGTALINRIKADPSLSESEIRVVSRDGEDGAPIAKAAPAAASPAPAPAASAAPAPVATAPAPVAVVTEEPPPVEAPPAPVEAEPPPPQKFDTGTRRFPRFKIAGQVDVLVDGKTMQLVDISLCGAQVISANILKPKQRVRTAFADEAGNIRFTATVAWASFEIPPKSGPRYRAGIDFVDADQKAVEAYLNRHKA